MLCVALTFLFLNFTWMLFRSANLSQAGEFVELLAEELGDGWKQLKTVPDCSFAGMEDVEKRFSVWYRDTIGQVKRK